MSKTEPTSPIRTYAVETDGVGGFRMVRARSQAQARNYVAAETIRVRLATAEDGYEAGRLGVDIEDAAEPPVPPINPNPADPDAPLDDKVESALFPTSGDAGQLPADSGELE